MEGQLLFFVCFFFFFFFLLKLLFNILTIFRTLFLTSVFCNIHICEMKELILWRTECWWSVCNRPFLDPFPYCETIQCLFYELRLPIMLW
jgi:hypothetical protein